MAKSLLPYGKQWIDKDDVRGVVRTLQSDFITQGPRIEEFERRIADFCGARYAVAYSSGTAALHAASYAIDLGQGDEAITSPISFIGTANAIVFQRARPVFADIELDTVNLDPSEVEKRITSRTKAIFAVDFAGHPAPLRELKRIAKAKGLYVVEDAAHALGAKYHGRRVGALSDISIFSFHPVKHITTGEGGMALTNNAKLCRRLRLFRNHGMVRSDELSEKHGPWYYAMEDLGYNYRVSDIQCALGLSQFRKVERFLRLRRKLAASYLKKLKGVSGIILPKEKMGIESSYHLFVIQLKTALKAQRRILFEEMRRRGIGVNVHYIPIHLQPYYIKNFAYKAGDYPNAELYYSRALTLPLFPAMRERDVDQVVQVLVKSLAGLRSA
ncbi:MAG: UDP-4-amino-4,6-dideoxy-N-acetyl-beta-L-altrosamine transaminase [Candidatus Omnitrophota bacterium]|nr:UDP-4-amino-4,6-dideoxy-N-acetyl-beta-L-altrosamine transaminase [Candidatus Omnitrophota bacterium]